MPLARPASPAGTEPRRRLPSQHRSRIRVGRILDAAGTLIVDRGYEATTPSLIVRHARVSPGSFYQFFADKRAVVQALATRNLAVFLDRLDARLLGVPFPHWWEEVEVVLDVYVGLCREQPGFRAVRFGGGVDSHLLDQTEDNDTVAAERIAALLGARVGVRDTADLRLALVTTLKVTDALVRYAFVRDRYGDDAVLGQARFLLRVHLERYVHPDR